MKIAIISTFLGQKWSGGEMSSFLLAENLNKKEDIFVVTSKVTEKIPFKCYSMPLLKHIPNLVLLIGHRLIDYYMFHKFLKIFEKEKPHIIHIQDYSMITSALKAAKKMNIPCVFTARSYQFICNLSVCLEYNKIKFNCHEKQYKKCLFKSINQAYGPSFSPLNYLISPWFYKQNIKIKNWFKKIDYYITVSDFVKEQIAKSGINKNKIKTIKVPKENWIPKDIKKENKDIIIFSAGGLKKTKGFHYLIKSFKLVAHKYPQITLRIAGDGSARNKLEKMVKKLGLSKNVYFLGKIAHDKMQDEYTKAHFVISPSLWPEPLSRIIFEAFSMKKTIIATNVGGSSELVKRNKTGLLVKAEDEKEMSDAIIKLIEKPELTKKMGINAHNLINKECDEETVYTKHLKIYKKLINCPHSCKSPV